LPVLLYSISSPVRGNKRRAVSAGATVGVVRARALRGGRSS